MLIRFKTENGSVYAVDTETKLATRLTGPARGESRRSPDGVWRNYITIVGPEVGFRCLLVWNGSKMDGDQRYTSPVTEVVEVPGGYAHEVSDAEILAYEPLTVVE